MVETQREREMEREEEKANKSGKGNVHSLLGLRA